MKGVRRTGFRQSGQHPDFSPAVSSVPALRGGPHPAVGAFICAFGLLLMGFSAYQLFDDVPEPELKVIKLQFMAAFGVLVWLSGSVMLGRSVGLHPVTGFVLGLLFLPGLVVLWLLGRARRRQIALDVARGADNRPSLRNIRPLY